METLVTGGVALVYAVLFVVVFGLAFFWPLIAFFSMRHLRGIRVELARMNDNLERNAIVEGDVRPFVKTGSLNIR